ncbi:MAG TPA: rhamnulokinase family protein [Anaerolineales bacterium]|jgi:rhamnulokinase
MTKSHNYLAIDLGAESGRTIVGTLADGKLSLSETHRFPNTPLKRADGLHWNVEQLWNDIKAGIRISASQFPLTSLGLDTWGVDFALMDANGALLDLPFHYRDERTDGILEEAFNRVPREQIFAQTGIQFMQINSLYQLLAMRLKNPALLEASQTFLTIPDLFNNWLSGKTACEFTLATTTQCYDPLRRDWAWPLLEKLDIPARLFKPVSQPGTVLGNLLAEVAEETGAKAIPVIAPACHDTGSAVVAVPARNKDFAWISSGTWSIMGCEANEPAMDERALAYNFTNEGGVFGTWRLSKNIIGLWLVQECRRTWQAEGEALSYDEITRLAAEARPFLAVIDPDDTSFLHPGNMPERIRQYCTRSGQAVPKTNGEIVRVALESIALKYRLVLERLEEVTGKHFNPLHIIGGGTKNRLLNQFSADCTGRNVVSGPIEATAIGNVLMQAISLGHLDSLAAARDVVRASFTPETYQPRSSKGWEQAYAILQKVTK